jgi:hypothetical protein
MPANLALLLPLFLLAICHGANGESTPVSYTDITLTENVDHELRFVTGRVVYVEALREGRWVSRFWNASARINWPFELWEEDAFHLEIDGKAIEGGWTWASATESEKTDRGARHHIVELFNRERSIRLRVHTVLDGTPIIQRWLEIKNESGDAVALTGISPWSSRIWANPGIKHPGKDLDVPFRLGYFARNDWAAARVFHHAPINRRGDVESSPWFAMEFASPDQTKGWATIVRIGESDNLLYLFKPKGVDVGKTYRVTFDSTGSTIKIKGWELKRDGLPVHLETRVASELLLFEAS